MLLLGSEAQLFIMTNLLVPLTHSYLLWAQIQVQRSLASYLRSLVNTVQWWTSTASSASIIMGMDRIPFQETTDTCFIGFSLFPRSCPILSLQYVSSWSIATVIYALLHMLMPPPIRSFELEQAMVNGDSLSLMSPTVSNFIFFLIIIKGHAYASNEAGCTWVLHVNYIYSAHATSSNILWTSNNIVSPSVLFTYYSTSLKIN
jgi:hypothetical protein